MASKSRGRKLRAGVVGVDGGYVPPDDHQRPAKAMLVVRESDASDRLLFTDMISQTVNIFLGQHPSLEVLATAGCEPFDHPDKWGAVVTTGSQARSCQFVHDGMLVLYHMGSAARVDDGDRGNFFTDELAAAFTAHEPTEVLAATFSRLVRDVAQGNRLSAVLQEMRSVVRTVEGTIDFSEAHSGILWSALSAFASQEREAIHRRTLLGKIADSGRNRWPHGTNAVPPGYAQAGTSLRPDLASVEAIGTMLRLMADPTMSNAEFVQAAGGLGISRPRIRKLRGEESTVADVAHPKDIRASLEAFLELYETGDYVMPLPILRNENRALFGGLPVKRGSAGQPFVELRYKFGLPPKGWAPPHVFAAIRQRMANDDRFATRSNVRRPFSGRTAYRLGEQVLQIDTNASKGYRLLEIRPIERDGEVVDGYDQTLAIVDARDLQTVVFDGIRAALEDPAGIPGMPARARVSTAPEAIDLLEYRISTLSREAAAARMAAATANDELTREVLLDTAIRVEQERTRYEEEWETIRSDPLAGLPTLMDVDLSQFMEVLTALSAADISLPNEIARQIHSVIPIFTLAPCDNPGELEWTAIIELPASGDHYLRLGPIIGRVPVRGSKVFNRNPHKDKHLLKAFASGAALEDVVRESGYRSVRATVPRLRTHLRSHDVPDNVIGRIVTSPIPELRVVLGQVVLSGLVEEASSLQDDIGKLAELITERVELPDRIDRRWAALALSLTLRSDGGSNTRWAKDSTTEQRAIDVLVGNDGETSLRVVLTAVADHPGGNGLLIKRLVVGSSMGPPCLERVEPWELEGRRADQENRVRLFSCPHCGDALTIYLRAAEITRGLLCARCHRAPTDRAVFPDSYFTLPTGKTNLSHTIPARPAKGPRSRRQDIADFGETRRSAITSDYATEMKIADLLTKHDITSQVMYEVVDAAGQPRRRPYRPRGTSQSATKR